MLEIASIFRVVSIGLAGTFVLFSPAANADNPVPSPAGALVKDALATSASRSANAALNGCAAEKGEVAWEATDDVVFGSAGGVTVNVAQAGMAAVPIRADSGKPLRVQADVNPQGSGFTAVVLLDDGNLANFWKTAALWAYVGAGGNWGLYSHGQTNVLAKGVVSPDKFKPGDFNRLELVYSPARKKVSLLVNGTVVARDLPIVTAPDSITVAGIRINDPVTAGEPLIKNFAVDQPDAAP